ncbi:MAG: hypothetical protein AB7E84_08260 [Xanthobacteraceae bacterium]
MLRTREQMIEPRLADTGGMPTTGTPAELGKLIADETETEKVGQSDPGRVPPPSAVTSWEGLPAICPDLGNAHPTVPRTFAEGGGLRADFIEHPRSTGNGDLRHAGICRPDEFEGAISAFGCMADEICCYNFLFRHESHFAECSCVG